MRSFIALGVFLGILGCAAIPLHPQVIQDPALQTIQLAFEHTVRAAHNNTQYSWHSGWLGNIWSNTFGGEHVGLCYHWRDWVYLGVAPTVEQLGWQAMGININRGTGNEHHAVLVFDPKQVQTQGLLEQPQAKPAYVLDAWRHGRADIYPLDQWLTLAWRRRTPPALRPMHPERDRSFSAGLPTPNHALAPSVVPAQAGYD